MSHSMELTTHESVISCDNSEFFSKFVSQPGTNKTRNNPALLQPHQNKPLYFSTFRGAIIDGIDRPVYCEGVLGD